MSLPFGLTISPSILAANVADVVEGYSKQADGCEVNTDTHMDDVFNSTRNEDTELEHFVKYSDAQMKYFLERGFPADSIKVHGSDKPESCKILGIIFTEDDKIQVRMPLEYDQVRTRRDLASYLGRRFDPLGCTEELGMMGKVLYRKALKNEWDEQLPAEILTEVEWWGKKARVISEWSWPRRVFMNYLRSFVDASQSVGWGVAVVDLYGTRVLAKASLWSVQQSNWTVPRKELYSLLMAVDLTKEHSWEDVVYFSDSEINVARVNNKTRNSSLDKLQIKWLEVIDTLNINLVHIMGTWNPADGLSRALISDVSVDQLLKIADFVKKRFVEGVLGEIPPWKCNNSEALNVLDENFSSIAMVAWRQGQQSLPLIAKEALDALLEDNKASEELEQLLKDSNSFFKEQGVVYAKGRPSNKLCIDSKSRYLEDVIRKEHIKNAVHFSFKNTYHNVREKYYFKSQFNKVQTVVRNCQVCQLTSRKEENNVPSDVNKLVTLAPWDVHGVDLVGPVDTVQNEKCYILTITDRYSRFNFFDVLTSMTASEVINQLDRIYQDWGYPIQIVSDHGTQFISDSFRDWCLAVGTKHVLIPPGYPQYGGFYERVHQVFVRAFMSVTLEKGRFLGPAELRSAVKTIQNILNVRNLRDQIVFNRNTLCGVDRMRKIQNANEEQLTVMNEEPVSLSTNDIIAQAEELQLLMTERSNDAMRRKIGRKRNSTLVVGQYIYTMRTSGGSKYMVPWEGPYQITRVQGSSVFVKTKEFGRLAVKEFHRDQILVITRLFDNSEPGI